MTDQQGGIRIGDLLVRAGVVTAADCAEAERLSVEMKAQFGRLLILAGCLTEQALACALEAQAFIKQGVISFDIAIEALAFAVEESMSLEQALELLDLLPQFGTATLELAKLIGEARIVPEDNLIEALEHSVQTNIPLSEVLLAEQLISADMLGLMNVLHEQIRTNSLDRPIAVKDLRAEYALWRRGNYSTKSSRNKIPAYPQAQEVRKTFHQIKAMLPSQPFAPAPHAAPVAPPQAPMPVASADFFDFNQSSPVAQRSVAPQAVSNVSAAQGFKGVDSGPSDRGGDEQSKGLDLDKLQTLKALAFHGPVGAPLPLLLDDALPAVPIAALQSADHWNSLEAKPSAQFSQPSPPPSAVQPSFNPFASGPDFYSEPPRIQSAPPSNQFMSMPAPAPPQPLPAQPTSAYETAVPEEHNGEIENLDWAANEPATPPVDEGEGWSWNPSPEELEEAVRSPLRFAWESEEQPSEQAVDAVDVVDVVAAEENSTAAHRFVWEPEPDESSSAPLPLPSVQAPVAAQSFEPPAVPYASSVTQNAAKSELETVALPAPDVTTTPERNDTPDSVKFVWVPEAEKVVAAKTDETTIAQPPADIVPPVSPLSLPAEESIAALAEATLASQFSLPEVSSSPEVASLFKWDPPDYSTPPSALFGGLSVPEDEELASLDRETEISEQADAGRAAEEVAFTGTPLSLNFERSSFGSTESFEVDGTKGQAATPEAPAAEEAKSKAKAKGKFEAKVEPEVKVASAPATKKGKKRGKGGSAIDQQTSETAIVKVDDESEKIAFAAPSLLLPGNPDLLHLLKAANCFVESDLQNAFVSVLNDPALSLELLKLLNVVDKATLDSAARINKLVKEGTVDMKLGIESLTGIQKGEIKHADLTKVLGLDKAKPKPKAKRKR
jgi:hypothetical protein